MCAHTSTSLIHPHRIGFALYAQFGPGKFPANWWSVAFCVASYSILTMVINLYSQRVEGDAYLVCKPRPVRVCMCVMCVCLCLVQATTGA